MITQNFKVVGWLWKRTYSDGHTSEEFCKDRRRAELLCSRNSNTPIRDQIIEVYCKEEMVKN